MVQPVGLTELSHHWYEHPTSDEPHALRKSVDLIENVFATRVIQTLDLASQCAGERSVVRGPREAVVPARRRVNALIRQRRTRAAGKASKRGKEMVVIDDDHDDLLVGEFRVLGADLRDDCRVGAVAEKLKKRVGDLRRDLRSSLLGLRRQAFSKFNREASRPRNRFGQVRIEMQAGRHDLQSTGRRQETESPDSRQPVVCVPAWTPRRPRRDTWCDDVSDAIQHRHPTSSPSNISSNGLNITGTDRVTRPIIGVGQNSRSQHRPSSAGPFGADS